jgi:tetratricopeptide (TPR) repeat protein
MMPPMSAAVSTPPATAPLVGRDGELQALRRSYGEAVERKEARVVTLVGPAGMGKHRLIETLAEELESRRGARVYRGGAGHESSAYGAFSHLIRSRFGIGDALDPEVARATLHQQVSAVLGDRRVGDVCVFLGDFIGLDFPETPLTRAATQDPVQARLLQRAVVKSFIEADAATNPVVLTFDALHDTDEDSLELIEHLVDTLKGPIFVVCSARPHFLSQHPEWTSRGGQRHKTLELGPLSEEDSIALLTSLLARCRGGPPARLIESGVSMAGGAPGLLKHIVRVFLDAGVLVEEEPEGPWRVDLEKLTSARLPLTVEDAVSVRIAALAPAERRLLEHAAAMGSVFWRSALLALGRIDREVPEFWNEEAQADALTLKRLLASLVQRDYLLRLPDSTFSDEAEYVFKHNLERETVARLTPAASARRYHQTIADWLSQKEAIRNQEEHSAMLARHLEKAGATSRAAITYLESGNIAREHFAAKRADEYYRRGLELLGGADARRRLDALHDHGGVLVLLGRTDDALAAFREMLSIAYRLGFPSKGGAAHSRIGRLYRDTGSFGPAEQHLRTALALFESTNDVRGVASCHDDIGRLLWIRGEYKSALEEMRKSLGMRKELGDGRSIALSLNNIGLVWRDHGRVIKAQEALESALKIRRELNDPLGIVESLNELGQLALDQGDPRQALTLLEEAHATATDIGEHNRIAVVLINIGEACLRLEQVERAVEVLTRAEELCDELGDKLHLAEAKRALAKAHLARGELRKAREAIKRSVDLFGQVRSKPHLAMALRTLGEVTGAGAWGDGHEIRAVDYFLRSIAICKEIGNEMEVAKSYRAFSIYVENSPHYQNNPEIMREAEKLAFMADEIFARHRLDNPSRPASSAFPPPPPRAPR